MSDSYIRGGAVELDRRRARQVIEAALIVVLAALAVGFGVAGARSDDTMHRLATHGVPLRATVTGCVAEGGGTGTVIAGYTCRASVEFQGRTYTGVLLGTDARFSVGQAVSALADPTHPATLAPAAVVARAHRSWAALITAGVALVALAALLARRLVRRRARPA